MGETLTTRSKAEVLRTGSGFKIFLPLTCNGCHFFYFCRSISASGSVPASSTGSPKDKPKPDADDSTLMDDFIDERFYFFSTPEDIEEGKEVENVITHLYNLALLARLLETLAKQTVGCILKSQSY